MFREGRTKAVGNVNKIIPYVPAIVAKEPKKTGGQQLRGDGKKRQQGSGHRDPTQRIVPTGLAPRSPLDPRHAWTPGGDAGASR